MFIELTDHLRCLAEHEEAYLVLLPDRMEGRDVRAGQVGCPVCGWTAAIRDGVLDYGGPGQPLGGERGESAARSPLTPDAIHALLGLGGPGGVVALVGVEGDTAAQLASLLPGVHLAVINPSAPPPTATDLSLLYAPRLPLKRSSMRGVVLAGGWASDARWLADGIRAVLPGLRIVIEAPAPASLPQGATLLAAGPNAWVGVKLAGRMPTDK